MVYLHTTPQSRIVYPRGPYLLFLLIGNEAQLPYSGPSRQGLDCYCLLKQGNCGKSYWIAMQVQEWGPLVMKRSQSWLSWFRTVFSLLLNMVHKQFWLAYYVFIGSVCGGLFILSFFPPMNSVNVAVLPGKCFWSKNRQLQAWKWTKKKCNCI